MTAVISIYAHVSDPLWKHDTIDYERGFSDATRGLDRRPSQPDDYRFGYRDGLEWKKKQDPMRFRSKA